MKERRRSPRAKIGVLLEICSQDKKTKMSKGFITDISELGLGMETTERLGKGNKYSLQFTLLNGWSFDLLGEIVYSREGILTKAYGVRFYDIPEQDRAKLKDYVTTRLQQWQ